jgi:hypothetical protein
MSSDERYDAGFGETGAPPEQRSTRFTEQAALYPMVNRPDADAEYQRESRTVVEPSNILGFAHGGDPRAVAVLVGAARLPMWWEPPAGC